MDKNQSCASNLGVPLVRQNEPTRQFLGKYPGQKRVGAFVVAALALLTVNKASASDLKNFERGVVHHTVSASGVQIHYAEKGEGNIVLFLHGFPDHWLTWWRQMDDLAADHRVAAMDLRGFNLSSQPTSPDAYEIDKLIADVEAVIDDLGGAPVTLIGHDWGGFLAWHVAMQRPELISRLVIVNIPHPWAVAEALATNPAQDAASQYVDFFRSPAAPDTISREQISNWISDSEYLERHNSAMDRSEMDAMLNYYRTLYPKRPYRAYDTKPIKITAPTLVVFGAKDPFLLVSGLNATWDYVSAPLTITVWPDAGHFAQHDQPARLNALLRDWLSSN
ncbi:alpha/beta fold hydrolase [Roseibium algicola]|uniref:alpha/beta fold hydrolase n=1 Tax=Roseibium algicola TaxID=2857014 RepID=UPI00098508A8|nr:alpha/beta hydrolase [Roseibium aggregatum]